MDEKKEIATPKEVTTAKSGKKAKDITGIKAPSSFKLITKETTGNVTTTVQAHEIPEIGCQVITTVVVEGMPAVNVALFPNVRIVKNRKGQNVLWGINVSHLDEGK